jgi:SynChlorMet cassette radical SAM/SPASM protein ScmE
LSILSESGPGNDPAGIPPHLSTPEEAEISITGRCNLKCRYCFYADEMAARNDLTTAEWEKAFRKLSSAKLLRVILTGGEVFTRPDIFQLIDSIIAGRMRYSILTNGTLVDERVVGELKKGNRLKRLDSIQVSIDGSSPEIHNISRPDSFEKALRGLILLQRSEFPVTARVTIGKNNVRDMDETARLLLEDVGLASFTTCDASPIGAGCSCGDELALDHRDILKAGLSLEALLEKYPGRINAQAGPLAVLRMYRRMEEIMAGEGEPDPSRMGHLAACAGVFDRLAILHDGSVVPCSMLHDMVMGNILNDDLEELWRGSPLIRQLRERYCIPMSSIDECHGCEWADLCMGGCPGVALQIRGSLLEPDLRSCYREFLRENGIGSIREITDEN